MSKVRSRNFSNEERRVLTEEVSKFPIINARLNDDLSIKKKRDAWRTVADKFNSRFSQAEEERTIDSLKKQYDNMKLLTKKRLAERRTYANKTGGGPAENVKDPI